MRTNLAYLEADRYYGNGSEKAIVLDEAWTIGSMRRECDGTWDAHTEGRKARFVGNAPTYAAALVMLFDELLHTECDIHYTRREWPRFSAEGEE